MCLHIAFLQATPMEYMYLYVSGSEPSPLHAERATHGADGEERVEGPATGSGGGAVHTETQVSHTQDHACYLGQA